MLDFNIFWNINLGQLYYYEGIKKYQKTLGTNFSVKKYIYMQKNRLT